MLLLLWLSPHCKCAMPNSERHENHSARSCTNTVTSAGARACENALNSSTSLGDASRPVQLHARKVGVAQTT